MSNTMLLGLMPPRPSSRNLNCRSCGGRTRHTVGYCQDPRLRQVGCWFSKCVFCDSPLQYITLPLPRVVVNVIKAYHEKRKELVNTGTGGTHHWSDRDEYDVDQGISGEFYESSITGVPVEFHTDNFPLVSMWDCPSIKRRYEDDIHARFQVLNPRTGKWQVVFGNQPFAFVPFTPIVVKLYGVHDSAYINASIQEATELFVNATAPATASTTITASSRGRKRGRSPSPQPRTPPPGRSSLLGASASSISSTASSMFKRPRTSSDTNSSPISSAPRRAVHTKPRPIESAEGLIDDEDVVDERIPEPPAVHVWEFLLDKNHPHIVLPNILEHEDALPIPAEKQRARPGGADCVDGPKSTPAPTQDVPSKGKGKQVDDEDKFINIGGVACVREATGPDDGVSENIPGPSSST
ncbi:hypothetical protein AURDEDRAFT_131603 [Auricularia subglabra TFB-10046 SS5]|uniref:Uncharacterized protein n=1 Tax=Auricularia subglabra (strain TFB-10046 / SS5) TaxID=717982 RepID=J0LAZ5_AURST|nr:hypothetical protein AURDEDRAFT_131603 [Auricularia subglabra TFB-10046 SS5]